MSDMDRSKPPASARASAPAPLEFARSPVTDHAEALLQSFLSPARRIVRLFSHVSFPRFLGVGAVGFLIDAAILFVLIRGAGMPPVPSRVASFSVAVVSTWLLNRMWTFGESRSSRPLPEFLRYLAVQLSGGAVNLAIFALVAWALPDPLAGAALGLVAGSAAGLVLNYIGARFVAFAVRSDPVIRP
jgi:putative flippase GtrA